MINKILNSPLVSLFSLIDLLITFGKYIFELLKYTKGAKPVFDMTIFEVIVRLITALFLYILWSAYLKLKKEIENQQNDLKALNLIGKIRIKEIIFRQTPTPLKLPNESDKKFHERTREGVYNSYISQEYNVCKNQLIHELNINPKKAEDILDKYYKSKLSEE